MHLKSFSLLAVSSLMLFGSLNPAQAAESIQLEDSHVRPDYVEVERLKGTKNVIVIEKKDIQGKGYRNLSEVLDEVPSINVGLTGWGDIDIRGQGAEQSSRNIQVLLDGAPITTLTSHPLQNNYNYIPVDDIEKIEIIPGGGSVMYGSGAAGGVINITTNLKNMRKPVNALQTNFTSRGEDLTLNYGDNLNDKTNLQFTYTNTKEDLYFNNTYRQSEYFAGGVAHKIDDSSRLTFRFSHLEDEGQFISTLTKKNFEKYGKDYKPADKVVTVGVDASGNKIKRTISGYLDADRQLDTYSLNYAKNFSEHSRFSADVFYNDGYFVNNNLGDKKMDHATKGAKLKYDYKYGGARKHSVLVGFDYYKQDSQLQYNDYKGSNPTKIHPLYFFYDKTVKAAYLSNTFVKDKWEFVQGVRQDYTEWGFDKEAASSAGAATRKTSNTAIELATAYQYNDIGRLYARYEKGFTAPDGVQVADDTGATISGTSANDEHFDLFEVGVRDKIGISSVQLTLFRSKTDNQLDRWLASVPGQGLVRRTLNLVKTERKGIEFSARQKINKWTFSQSYAYLKGKSNYNDEGLAFLAADKQTEWTQQSLRQVPKHKFVIKTKYDFNAKFAATLQYKYVGKYNNFLEDKNAKDNEIGSHKLVDLDLTYKIKPSTTLHVGVRNLFNEKYTYYVSENSGGYYSLLPGDERTYYMGLHYKF